MAGRVNRFADDQKAEARSRITPQRVLQYLMDRPGQSVFPGDLSRAVTERPASWTYDQTKRFLDRLVSSGTAHRSIDNGYVWIPDLHDREGLEAWLDD